MNDDAWDELLKDIPIELQPGEVTVPMLIERLDRPIDYKTMKKQVERWVEEGKAVRVGKRIYNNASAEAYKVI